MSFSCLEDIIAYLYAFHDSMRIDLTMQFDLLPISVRKKVHFCTRTFLKSTFMIKLCVKNRRLSLQKNQNQSWMQRRRKTGKSTIEFICKM